MKILRGLLFLIGLAAIALLVLRGSGDGRTVTRGDVMDRNAALAAERCARQYLRPGQPATERNDIWAMCLDVTAQSTGRDRAAIARHLGDRP